MPGFGGIAKGYAKASPEGAAGASDERLFAEAFSGDLGKIIGERNLSVLKAYL